MGGLHRPVWHRASPQGKSRRHFRTLISLRWHHDMDPAEDGLPIPQRYWAILTLMVGVALSCLDTALVNVALPRIAKDLNSSPADSIWVVNAYQLAVMISLLPLASFGDIFGYGRV